MDLIRMRLSEANEDKPTELSDTKSEMLKQATNNINQMVSSEDLGVIVSILIILLTDKVTKNQLASLGKRYEDHLAGGGKETDFTSAIGRIMKPLIEKILKAIESVVGVEAEDPLMLEAMNVKDSRIKELYKDLDIKTKGLERLTDYAEKKPEIKNDQKYKDAVTKLNADIEEIKDWLKKLGEGLDVTKNKLRNIAMNRIREMSSDPNVMRVFSLFLYYLTDKDTVSSLKQMGSIYGHRLKSMVNHNKPTWTEEAITKMRTLLNPVISKLSDIVAGEIPQTGGTNKTNQPTKNPTETDQDDVALKNIMKKYQIT